MPDWSYHTLIRPLLFRLRPEAGRDMALGAMGRLAALPGGVRIIQFFGHMAPDGRLATDLAGVRLPGPVGLGRLIDPRLVATRALAELGVGYLEIGPIGDSTRAAGPIERGGSEAVLRRHAPEGSIHVDEARRRLTSAGSLNAAILVRVDAARADRARQIVQALAPRAAAFVAPIDALEHVADAAADASRPLLIAISADRWSDPSVKSQASEAVAAGRAAGLVIDPPQSTAGAPSHEGVVTLSPASLPIVVDAVRDAHRALGPHAPLIAAGGIHTPGDALQALSAGASVVQIDSGLVFSGPGLPKRINDAVLYDRLANPNPGAAAPNAAAPHASLRPAEQSWFWALLLGLSLLGGGLLALAIAVTRVTLPYDEALTGLTRDQLAAINPRLLAFMTHDRVTLAGTMLALGLQYAALAYCGIRHGQHWAQVAVTASALTGFFTFFAFLGFGYFDPFHAFVAAILLQFTLLAMHAPLGPRQFTAPPGLHNDEAWRSHQWGQLLFVVHGTVLIVAGAVIVAIGTTRVFIREDLEFLDTTAEALVGAHPQLKPLVAHDRATFGGMLISCGLATLLSALWGFQRGHAWLWRTLMIAGNVAYLCTLAVHMNVGYSSHLHLLPVYGGLIWLWAGGLFSYPYMVGGQAAEVVRWSQGTNQFRSGPS